MISHIKSFLNSLFQYPEKRDVIAFFTYCIWRHQSTWIAFDMFASFWKRSSNPTWNCSFTRLSADIWAFSSSPSNRAAYHNISVGPNWRPWIYPHIYRAKWSSGNLLTTSGTTRRRYFTVRLYVREDAYRKLQRCPDHLSFRVVLCLSKMSDCLPTKSELVYVTIQESFRVIHDVGLNIYSFFFVRSWVTRIICNVGNPTILRDISSTRNILTSCTYFYSSKLDKHSQHKWTVWDLPWSSF